MQSYTVPASSRPCIPPTFTVSTKQEPQHRHAANACRESVRTPDLHFQPGGQRAGCSGLPSEETSEPQPVTVYGQSKRLGEIEIRQGCRVAWTILRPAAVYGPRDAEFLNLFQKVKRRMMPLVSGAKRSLNMVYGPDVAAAVLCSLRVIEAPVKPTMLRRSPV